LSDMKNVVTIRLDDDLDQLLNKLSRRLRRNKSELIREAIRRQLFIYSFENLRERSIPFAEKEGYITDEDIFQEIS
jgi:predicted transcriptional regulator